MNQKIILTGISTTGRPHLGNYAGAIRPAIEASLEKNLGSFYFLADYHSLVKSKNPEEVKKSPLFSRKLLARLASVEKIPDELKDSDTMSYGKTRDDLLLSCVSFLKVNNIDAAWQMLYKAKII